jgi:uncharacterized protein (TIGR00725 family)
VSDTRATRRRIVAVVGNASPSAQAWCEAETLGRMIVERGYRVVTGGLGGVMQAASRGARSAANYREGDVVGVIPGADPASANDFCDIVVPTNMGYARNVLVVSMADAVVAVGGGSGTLSEIAMAWQMGRLVVALEIEGWSARLAGNALDDKRADTVLGARDAAHAVEIVAGRLGP